MVMRLLDGGCVQAAGFAVLVVGTMVYARGDEAQEKEEGARKLRHPVIKGSRTIGLSGTTRSIVLAERFIRR